MTAPHPGPMPALYLSHGAPPLVDDELWTGQLAGWSAALPRPRAILVISAHWESAPLMLGATDTGAPLTYDFTGFAERYYRTEYRSPGAPELAAQVAALMPDAEPVAHLPRRGLDHGAYVPLTVMYPDADVPVLQMSLPTLDPTRLLEIGRRLRPLRDDGVLIIGSGFTTHGLPFLTDPSPRAAAPTWSQEFDLWAGEALTRGAVDELAAYADHAPGMPYAHPTAEHFAPLFVTLGAATDPEAPPEQLIDGYWMGLAKRSFQVA
ncbi:MULTISPECIES: dioxygenase [unclassified Saccharopolyspora]|uniref:dioxygenase family protein n=1 Tax=unclassified Saccharopolyspora TaxID=2646250 RepID=UPI001CD3A70F|nr:MULTISPECIES: class III extradiol ring-cleavage dioxygenase [unclassified Saccharopolyspora]MCA1187183.1 dioxygenase [Saccharopolyspora sp. 6T]MCA1195820.1 dioxygenase [Saccharopolyspora sp. 6V]MCA1228089.1 dioxygenase [Saccharopolyspora sp. 6M]